eukprot:3716977-Alexandrium_andersonii.AAC.1
MRGRSSRRGRAQTFHWASRPPSTRTVTVCQSPGTSSSCLRTAQCSSLAHDSSVRKSMKALATLCSSARSR